MRELEYPVDADYILSKKKRIQRELREKSVNENPVSIRVAILGGSTTSEVKDCLEIFLLNEGLMPTFYESEYGRFYEESVFDNDKLREFAPNIVYIHTSNRNIIEWPQLKDDIHVVEEKLQSVYERFEQVWECLRKRYECTIIQNNMEMPFYRLMGNMEANDFRGRVHFIECLNTKFNDYANRHPNFYINDIHYLSAYYGLEKWGEPYYWYMFKYSLNVEAIPLLSKNISHIIKSLYGKNKKAMVLDLDHTLWGGVIAEEGKDNISIGQETSVGQAYFEFQQFIKSHKDLGILLNIASKNDEEAALEGLSIPDSVLRQDDFISIKANWKPKSDNVIEIAKELNILPGSMVFIDDNPAERELLIRQVPGIAVPELSRVENYIKEINGNGYFEVTRLSTDDMERNTMYKENMQRNQAALKYENYQDYLKALEMKATIRPFSEAEISRIVQLANKSNQFNLTTKRYTQQEIEEIISDANAIALYARLKDRFGDNGIVALFIGRIADMALHVELWLMSCRVLKRDMEKAMLDAVISVCRKHNLKEIRGYYYPTQKNRMVKDFYGECGFAKVKEDDTGSTEWTLRVDSVRQKYNTVIELEDLYE